jgi:4-hydroxy-tetrahydrodipicolinate synthase
MSVNFSGVFPAITTPFAADGSVDHGFLAKHAAWMLESGCHGLVPCGSLGEVATLSFEEKVAVVKTCVEAANGLPVAPGVSSLSTQGAIDFAKASHDVGAQGLMVLPPYAYSTDWREMKAHMKAVIEATPLTCILYNNPIAYKTDFTPVQIAELAAECPNLAAVKESSADVRRIMAIRELIDGRLTLMMGVDDAIVEGIRVGVTGWIAGLVNAFPAESVALWRWTLDGKTKEADELYKWFLPLLRLDVVPKFVQLIKLTQQEVGWGSETVRGPRLVVEGAEREAAIRTIQNALKSRPSV